MADIRPGFEQEDPRNFRWERGDEIEASLKSPYLVKGVLPHQALCVIYGAPGCGKTFTALDQMLHLANGWDWMGHKVGEPMEVAYIAAEGGSGVNNRIAAWRKEHPDAVLTRFHKLQHQINMLDPNDDLDPLIADLLDIAPKVVTIDTLNRAMVGGNENDPKDMGLVIANSSEIVRRCGCTVVFVHHSGKDQSKGSRGHTSLIGAADTVIEVKDHNWHITKQKDGQDGIKLGFELKQVTLGFDDDDDPVTSCVVKPAEVHATIKPRKVGRNQLIVLDAITAMEHDFGKPSPGTTGYPTSRNVILVPVDQVKKEAERRMKATHPQGNKRRQAITRAIIGLKDAGAVQTRNEDIWRVY